ncbi:MAG: cytidylate kinase-like family protein [Clostridia bacterium]|nr:cytidylate kinase-like family protein [Clostridia bacterium]
MSNKIITISREFGSGGRTVAKEVAQKLGIPCYDQEIIEQLSEKSGLAKDFIKERGEYTTGGNWFTNALSSNNYGGSIQDKLWLLQRNLILELAEKGPCVFVGRCADYILKDRRDCLKVFIHADMEKRIERIVTHYGESSVAPEKRLRDKDKRRKAYYQLYTDSEWGVAQHYDISLNSGKLGIEKCVEIIADLYEQ